MAEGAELPPQGQAAGTDALRDAIDRYIHHEFALDPLLSQRVERAALDTLLDQLGWRLNDPHDPRA